MALLKTSKASRGIKDPWRAPETISPRNASAFGGGADVADGDGDLMMNLWLRRTETCHRTETCRCCCYTCAR
jgi:hypothetical protein